MAARAGESARETGETVHVTHSHTVSNYLHCGNDAFETRRDEPSRRSR